MEMIMGDPESKNPQHAGPSAAAGDAPELVVHSAQASQLNQPIQSFLNMVNPMPEMLPTAVVPQVSHPPQPLPIGDASSAAEGGSIGSTGGPTGHPAMSTSQEESPPGAPLPAWNPVDDSHRKWNYKNYTSPESTGLSRNLPWGSETILACASVDLPSRQYPKRKIEQMLPEDLLKARHDCAVQWMSKRMIALNRLYMRETEKVKSGGHSKLVTKSMPVRISENNTYAKNKFTAIWKQAAKSTLDGLTFVDECAAWKQLTLLLKTGATLKGDTLLPVRHSGPRNKRSACDSETTQMKRPATEAAKKASTDPQSMVTVVPAMFPFPLSSGLPGHACAVSDIRASAANSMSVQHAHFKREVSYPEQLSALPNSQNSEISHAVQPDVQHVGMYTSSVTSTAIEQKMEKLMALVRLKREIMDMQEKAPEDRQIQVMLTQWQEIFCELNAM